jgi:hypothetical protein
VEGDENAVPEASEKGCARAAEVAPKAVEAPTETENLGNKAQSAIEDTGDSLKLNCGLKVDAKALGVELVSFDEALATADFISLHMPLTPTTDKIFNNESLGKCKKDVRIINVVDSSALEGKFRVGATE